jgi:hypothetical protein
VSDEAWARLWRVLECVLGGLALAGLAALCAHWVDHLCFHNVAGVTTADPKSDRGPWCTALTGGSSWGLVDVGIAAAAGFVIHLIPIHSMYRWGLWGIAAIAMLVVPVYMSGLEYTVPF